MRVLGHIPWTVKVGTPGQYCVYTSETKETPSEGWKTHRDEPHHKPLLFLGFVFIVVKGFKGV